MPGIGEIQLLSQEQCHSSAGVTACEDRFKSYPVCSKTVSAETATAEVCARFEASIGG
jgi:hypothetical protein